MAQDNTNQPSSIRYIKGLFKDTSHIDQPAGTVRFARNAIFNHTTGAVTNEEGNISMAVLPANSIVIGTVSLTDDRIVLFILIGTRSEIGIYKDSIYTTLFNPVIAGVPVDTDMKFSVDYPIEGTYSEQSDEDIMVYWTDDLNPPRTINITRQLESSSGYLYGIDPNLSPDSSYIDRLNLFPHSGPVPHIELSSIDMGGECKSGVYYLALGYTDKDHISTNFVTVANPVSITPDVEGVLPIDSYDGAEAGSFTGKSIRWTVTNINTDYRYLTAAVVFDIGNGRQARKLRDTEISSDTFDIVFSGDQNSELYAVEEIVVDRVAYTKAKTISQLDNVLYLGNLESTKDLGYQKYANFITTTAVTKKFENFDPFTITAENLTRKESTQFTSRSNGYRDAINIFKYKGYTREEVYAFYIAFILKNGDTSYAYHIPGRAPMENVNTAIVPELSRTEWTSPAATGTVNEDAQLLWNSNDWILINITGGTENPLSHFFHWYDFSGVSGSNNMNYWHNLNELYPNTAEYDIIDATNPSANNGTLQGKNIRHHRFPSNLNKDFTTVESSNAGAIQGVLSQNTRLVVYYSWYKEVNDPGPATAQAADYQVSRYSEGNVNPMSENSVYNWENDLKDNNIWWNNNTVSCNPMTNAHLTVSNINNLNGHNPLDPLPGDTQTRFNIGNGEGNNFVQSGWKFGCGAKVDDIRFEYSGGGPPMNANVILGWNSYTLPANCGNICLGENRWDWAGPGGGSTVDRPDWADGWPWEITNPRPGWIAWAACEIITQDDSNAALTQTVQALGFKLSDVKIPKFIADQVQGFRIYYADRTHDNRTVLGQNPIHPMETHLGANLAGCNGGAIDILQGSSSKTDYFYPSGIPSYMPPNSQASTYAFHDFYLLNRQNSLSSATHIKLQYTLNMLQFIGNSKWYDNITPPELNEDGDPIEYLCVEPQVYTGFFASGTHNRIPEYLLNYTIKDKAKSYVIGDTFAELKHLGFSNPIYNIRSESKAAFELGPKLPLWLVSGWNARWRQNGFANVQTNNSPVAFDHYTQAIGSPYLEEGDDARGLMLYMANLKAFKTDVYDSVDTQDLVWTGYEVLGEDLNNFVVDDDGNAIPNSSTLPSEFTTDEIYGGDTFICRHGYRMTSNEQINGVILGPICNDFKSVVFTVVESTENINFRHIANTTSLYFPGSPLTDVLNLEGDIDLNYNPDTETGNIRYNEAYSAVNNVKAVYPKPIKEEEVTTYPTRVIRSEKTLGDRLTDAFRVFRADQYRVIPSNRGDLWKIVPANNLLMFQMEDTLFKTKGKQKMKLGDGSDAYVGSGDIFAQDPDELRPSDGGFMGTKAQRAAIVTPYGYFSVDVKNRKIFFVTASGVLELTSLMYGMQRWFQTNIPFALESYGFDGNIDNPIIGMGLHAVWDERYSRVILTKRDLKPTELFISSYKGVFETTGRLGLMEHPAGSIGFVDGSYYILQETEIVVGGITTSYITPTLLTLDPDSGDVFSSRLFDRTGWTISFTINPGSQTLGTWSSFHDYIPYIYSYSGIDVYSFVKGISIPADRGIYKHNNAGDLCKFYTELHPFEIEIIHNLSGGNNKLFYSLSWLADVLEPQESGNRDIKDLNAGFTSFIVYSSDANSGEIPLEYMINTRKTGGSWKVNQFRDMSLEVTDASIYYTGPFTGSNYGIVDTTVAGTSPAGVPTAAPLAMFIVDGMNEVFNTAYVDTGKPWHKRGKFIDRFLAFRLICNNIDNNLINLYNTEAPFRIQNR